MNDLELTGRAATHIVELQDPPCRLHHQVAQPFMDMRTAAASAGIDLVPVSTFRDFPAQVRIWNEKFQGRRTLYNRAGQPLEHAALTPSQIVQAILHWSALPGASRHHWGSEIDVIDRAALMPGQSAQLLPAEYETGGPFTALTAWLDANMQRFGFFKPYRTDRGGVSPEPWHLSYAPVSTPALGQLTQEVLTQALLESEIEAKTLVLEQLPQIYKQYVLSVDLL